MTGAKYMREFWLKYIANDKIKKLNEKNKEKQTKIKLFCFLMQSETHLNKPKCLTYSFIKERRTQDSQQRQIIPGPFPQSHI